MNADTNRITVNIHNARPYVKEYGGLLWLDVHVDDNTDITLFFDDPLVAIFVGEQLAAAGRRIQDATAKPTAVEEPKAVEEPWVG